MRLVSWRSMRLVEGKNAGSARGEGRGGEGGGELSGLVLRESDNLEG